MGKGRPRRRYGQPYTRFLNASNKKLSTPLGRFTLMKYYYVKMPTASASAPQQPAILHINASTPFQPLAVTSGTWTANDTNNEPHGLDTSPWTGYNHCVVLGCHVSCNIKDSIDKVQSGSESLHEGIVRLTRASSNAVVNTASTNSNLRERAFSKGRALELAKTTVTGIPKNCHVSQGYSAKRTWSANPMGQDQLRIANVTGSSNTPSDSTYIALSIHTADEKVTDATLKQFKVQLKITYTIKFSEPSTAQNVPRPIPSYPAPQRPRRQPSAQEYQFMRKMINQFIKNAPYMAGAYGAGLHLRQRAIQY